MIFKKIKIYLIAILFFSAGVAAANLLDSPKNNQTLADSSFSLKSEISPSPTLQWLEVSPSPATQVWREIPISNKNPNYNSSKYIIKQTQKITASRSSAETGEEVYFSTSLKNIGDKKKFLTHICFQYNGGNFGCILNTNLDPDQEFSFGSNMIFNNPGTYNVWITLSQDHTNFFQPLNGSMTTINIL